jgi:hypothetical protein
MKQLASFRHQTQTLQIFEQLSLTDAFREVYKAEIFRNLPVDVHLQSVENPKFAIAQIQYSKQLAMISIDSNFLNAGFEFFMFVLAHELGHVVLSVQTEFRPSTWQTLRVPCQLYFSILASSLTLIWYLQQNSNWKITAVIAATSILLKLCQTYLRQHEEAQVDVIAIQAIGNTWAFDEFIKSQYGFVTMPLTLRYLWRRLFYALTSSHPWPSTRRRLVKHYLRRLKNESR